MQITESISLGAALNEFVTVFMPSQNYAHKTCKEYECDVLQLVEWLESQQVVYADEVDFEHLEMFARLNRQQGLKDSTQARKIFSIKVFFGYLVEYGYIGRNPTNHLIPPQVERFPPTPMPIEQFEQCITVMTNPRDKAMLLLLAHTDIRQNELVELQLDDLQLVTDVQVGDANAGTVLISRSHSRHRFTIDYRCWSALQQWLSMREEIAVEGEGTVFLNRFGRKLTTRGLRYILSSYFKHKQINMPSTSNPVP